MGNPLSKTLTVENVYSSKTLEPSSPMMTPERQQEWDPRSPTNEFSRTPIQPQTISMIFENNHVDDAKKMCSDSPGFDVVELDPRSPSCEITRTPIIVKNSQNQLKKSGTMRMQIFNKLNPMKNILKSHSNVIVKDETKIDELEPKQVEISEIHKSDDSIAAELPQTPKLLESSPIKKASEKRRSYVGVLETNLDYIETDIDAVFQSKKAAMTPVKRINILTAPKDILRAKYSCLYETENKDVEKEEEVIITPEGLFLDQMLDPRSPSVVNRTPIQVLETVDVDPRSPTVEFVRTPIQVVRKIGEIDLNNIESDSDNSAEKEATDKHNLSDIPTESVVDIQQVMEKIDSFSFDNGEEIEFEEPEEIINKLNLTKSTPDLSNIDRDQHLKTQDTNPVINRIYEDNVPSENIILKRTSINSNRTPLSVRNSNKSHCRSKSANGRLKENDDPKKLTNYAVTKIPVYKKDQRKMLIKKKGVQCENTPPSTNLNGKNIKKAQWDPADNTLVI